VKSLYNLIQFVYEGCCITTKTAKVLSVCPPTPVNNNNERPETSVWLEGVLEEMGCKL